MVIPQLAARCEERLRLDGVPAERPRHTYFVPGRIEVLGKHTDYAGGRSLVMAVDRGICLSAVPRHDDRIIVSDAVSGERCECLLRPDLPRATGWANYPLTVVRRIARDFPDELCGADIAFASDLPGAAGLSSSTALVIAMFLGLSSINSLPATAGYRANIASTRTSPITYPPSRMAAAIAAWVVTPASARAAAARTRQRFCVRTPASCCSVRSRRSASRISWTSRASTYSSWA